ncbi:hypothetical protein AKJ37_05360 [candidate division MSBL1 archaeon SCGC-AAA259I09]|uniref:Uncharacterized protein n=1 Tax=candidate division MSBL1 archaeon SCGC-AAA259I09 TaxID=1698267 RepID=A0A133UQB1_9EURY|nr:hypothetical protein AKJ37_05360 [candidate division MSBL1 archaeon SCGC-AAA259I09]
MSRHGLPLFLSDFLPVSLIFEAPRVGMLDIGEVPVRSRPATAAYVSVIAAPAVILEVLSLTYLLQERMVLPDFKKVILPDVA